MSSPPNTLWQIFLENHYPSYGNSSTTDATKGEKDQGRIDPEQKLDKTNTLIKLVLDQTISASLNTAAYIAAVAAFKGNDLVGVAKEVQKVCF